jgi:L-aspartate oxidase
MARVPLAELRRRMWQQAGPVRDEQGLTALLDWLADRSDSNPVAVARLIAAAARARHESRGAHVRSDHPAENPSLTHHLCPQPSTA